VRLAVVLVATGCGRIAFDPVLAAPLIDAPLDPALVAWYPLDAAAATDATGHGHDGACPVRNQGCPTPTAGQLAGANDFSGVTMYEVPFAEDLNTPNGFTVSAWLFIAVAPATRGCAITKGLGPGIFNSWALCVEPDRSVFFYTVAGATENSQFSAELLATDAFHHVAVRYDGTTKSIFLDGANVGDSQPFPGIDFDSSAVFIGEDVDDNAPIAPFVGRVDDARLYNRALADSEIAALANL
jgi:concanavalin A-like lectin/glucanase superfamily protein